MNVPLLDLVAQYRDIKDEVLPAMMAVIERQEFIMGPEVGAARGRSRQALPHQARHRLRQRHRRAAAAAPGARPQARATRSSPPPFTFFATAGTIHNAGGTPVFVDIDPATFNISPAAIEAAITPRTRAIIVVHLFGQMAAMEQILPIAARHGLAGHRGRGPVHRRAAEDRRRPGGWPASWAPVGTFSFFPSKNLGGCGDGGMMVTQDDALAERLRRLRLHGGAQQYYHDEVGYQQPARHAAGGRAAGQAAAPGRLERRARAERGALHRRRSRAIRTICPPRIDPANEHIFNQYTIRVPRRDALQAHLKARGIGNAIYYPLSLHLQPCFAHLGYRAGQPARSPRRPSRQVHLAADLPRADRGSSRTRSSTRCWSSTR